MFVPRGGTLTLRLTHHLTITSPTSTIWFSRSLSYMANHMVFKVNHMVQGHTWTIPTPYYCWSSVTFQWNEENPGGRRGGWKQTV